MNLATRVGLLLVGWGSVAIAGSGTRKVDVESNPAGAAVYLNSVETKPVCTATPCTIDAPIGTSVVIVRKDGYEPEFGQLVVPRKGKIKPFKFTLASSFGTLAIDDPQFAGATILVDDVDQGVAPQRLDLEPKSHRVVVVLDKQELFRGSVTVETGSTFSLQPSRRPEGKSEPKPSHRDPPPTTAKASPTTPRRRSISAGALFAVHFRQFRYRTTKSSLPTQVESGQDTLGPTLEIWPAALFGSSRLPGLSLYGEAAFGINKLDVIDDTTGMSSGAKTHWRRFEVDVRHKWMFGRGGIEANAGFVSDHMSYKGDASQLPVGDYKAIRAGIRGKLQLGGPIAAYVAAEGRFALDSGPLADRLGGADVFGGLGALGVFARFGRVYAAVDGSVLYYRWTFSDTSVAEGARDLVETISARIGVQY